MTSTHPAAHPRGHALATAGASILLAVAALLPATAAHPTTPEPEPSPATWGVRPADTGEGSGRPNFAYEVQPGSLIRDAITVSNSGEQPLALGVYAADGLLTEDGTLDLLPYDEESELLGSWISLSADAIELAPGESSTIDFTVQVPEDATPGDYMAGIVSSLRTDDAGILTERRLGSRVGLRVAGELTPGLAVDGLVVRYDGSWNPLAGGTATIEYTAANEGNARIAASEDVRATGPLGLGSVDAPASELPELLPGSSVQRTIVLHDVPPLFWLGAEVVLGGEVVAIGGGPGQGVDAVTSLAATAAMPWAQLLLLILVVGSAVLLIRARRAAARRRIAAAVAAALAAQAAQETVAEERAASDAPSELLDLDPDRESADDRRTAPEEAFEPGGR